MCGRYSFVPTKKQLDEAFGTFDLPADLKISYNIAPTQQAYVIIGDAPTTLQTMTWGLVPHWSKDGANSGKLINARAEGILEKPSFRSPALRRHCLVPADSFYEWRTLPGKRKIPYRIRLQNGKMLFMAGIWEEWRGATGAKQTFSIITTSPNAEITPLHNRMPVILTRPDAQQYWLETQDPDEIRNLLHTPESDILELYRVSERLNSPGTEGPELHEPVPEDEHPTLFS
ncbi:MAG: SOS response-associated peptidase [Bacteroidetes bacterium]|nr:MAG: SOS response-associated peptidase [Bacteroidota bacterium]